MAMTMMAHRSASSSQSTMIHTLFVYCMLSIAGTQLGASAYVFPVKISSHTSFGSLSVSKHSWGIADDWSLLSDEHPDNSVPDTNEIFNEDLASQAAERMYLPGSKLSKEYELVSEAVETVHNHGFIQKPNANDPSLYDTRFEEPLDSVSFEDEMGNQISMLVNCNKRPEEMLISQGRALPPLLEEELNDVSQLVTQKQDGTYQATKFFEGAIAHMFQEHASTEINRDDNEDFFLDPAGVARWMTKSLGSEDQGSRKISAHDKCVRATLAKFAQYGTGRLSQDDFQRLYLAAVTESLAAGRLAKKDLPSIETVWRDIRQHGILSPVELERNMLEDKLRNEFGAARAEETSANGHYLDPLMDECELVEWYDDAKASSFLTDHSDTGLKRRKKSSHEFVELATDGKTPIRMRDGDFIFIDEESCIGCAQCALICPSSFLMLESGRARTFSQRLAQDVTSAISACPVDCMHKVSFDELKEFEVARDHGDGRSDHRHLGHRRGHTPLSVAGIDSDANHRSSWYHYLKQKCHTSSDCPRRGCYDCPNYSPGENPYFKAREKKAERVRVDHVISTGLADTHRRTAEL